MVNYSLIERNLNYTNSIMCCTTAEEDNTKNSYMIKFVKTFFCKIFLGVVYTIGGKYVFFVLILYIKILIFFNYKQECFFKKIVSKKKNFQEKVCSREFFSTKLFSRNFFQAKCFFSSESFFFKKIIFKKNSKKSFFKTILFNHNFFQ